MTSSVHMSGVDFLHREAKTPLSQLYTAAGAVCSFTTNCEHLLEAARDSFLPAEVPSAAADFSVRFWVDSADMALPPWPKPYVRGLDHLVFAGFDSGSSMLANLHRRHVVGRFSLSMAHDITYWKTVIFPILLTIMSASVGIAELHCACVVKRNDGLLLAGPSGSGKSTLALVFSQMGFGFLSDDRTFCSISNGEILAWGLPTRLKLRPDAAIWLKPSGPIQANAQQHGNQELWIDPHAIGLNRVRRCQPRSLIFLERQKTSGFRLGRVSPTEALQRLNADLIAESPERCIKRSETITRLAQVPCCLLEYGGNPRTVAQQICSELMEF
jgi:hypothetical protein